MTLDQLQKQEGVLMDTNLMLLYCVGRADPYLIPRFTKRLSRYSIDDYKLLIQFLALFKKVVTTPHILTETINLIDKRSGQYEQILRLFVDEITVIEERYVPAATITVKYSRHLPTFGLTDLVLYELAQESLLVLTDDGDIWSFIAGNSGSTLNFNQLRSLLLQKGSPDKRGYSGR